MTTINAETLQKMFIAGAKNLEAKNTTPPVLPHKAGLETIYYDVTDYDIIITNSD